MLKNGTSDNLWLAQQGMRPNERKVDKQLTRQVKQWEAGEHIKWLEKYRKKVGSEHMGNQNK